MAKIYSRVTKLNSIEGRSDYISNPNRQENLVLTGKSREFDWNEYSRFEKDNQKSADPNNEGRELVVALPNELSEKSEKYLHDFCNGLSKKLLGENRDYEYALHWNKSKTNFHMHLIFSERERNLEAQPKIYKKDLWVDSTTGKTCKKDNPNAVLRCRKGDVQRDSEGNIKYDSATFTAKDTKFKRKAWLVESKEQLQAFLETKGFKLDIYNPKTEIAQKKLFKGANTEYLNYAKAFNETAKDYNSDIKRLNRLKRNFNRYIDLDKKILPRLDEYEHLLDLKDNPTIRNKIEFKLKEKDYLEVSNLFEKQENILNSLLKDFDIKPKEDNWKYFSISQIKNWIDNLIKQLSNYKNNILNTNSLSKYKHQRLQQEKAKTVEVKQPARTLEKTRSEQQRINTQRNLPKKKRRIR